MSIPLRILLVANAPDDAALILGVLGHSDYALAHCQVGTPQAMKQALEEKTWDLILADDTNPEFSAAEALHVLKQSGHDVPFIVISSSAGGQFAVDTLKAGAHDCVTKDDLTRLMPAIQRELGEAVARRERLQAEELRRQNEEKIREQASLLNLAHDAILVRNLEDRIEFWNQGAERLYGWTAAEAVGNNVRPLLFPRTSGFEFAKRQLLERGEWLGDWVHPTKKGEEVTVRSRWTLLRDQHGQPKSILVIDTDITEQKRSEEALRWSQQRLINAQRVAHLGNWELDLKGQALHWSDEVYRLFGLDPQVEPASRELFFRCVHPADRELVRQAVAGAMADRVTYQLDHRIVLPSGIVRSVHEEAEVVLDHEGEAIRLVGTVQDITERKQVEEALRESETNYRMVVEASPDAIYVHRGGRIVFANSSTCRLLGARTPDQLIGKLAIELVHPDHRQMVGQRLGLGYERGATPLMEIKLVRLDGSTIDVDATSIRLTYGGKPAVQTIARNITERKSAEQRIHEQARLLELAQDVIVVRDLQNRIQFANPAASRLLGWELAKLPGRDMAEFIREDPVQTTEISESLERTGQWTGEMHWVARGGAEVCVHTHWTLVRDTHGQPVSVLTISTDITEKKRLETQFLRAQRMEGLGLLAGGIAHDLNNALTPVQVAVELLCMEQLDPGDRKRFLQMVAEGTQRAAEMVRQILTFSRGVGDKRTSLQLQRLINDLRRVGLDTFPKSIRVHTQLPDGLWQVTGDSTQLSQALLNLCLNARDAMPKGGDLILKAENVQLDEQYAAMHANAQPGAYVALSVTDTGQGMSDEIMKRIFEPFFTTKEIGKGTGLGLSTTLAIIKSHGGFIRVVSEIGKGSTLTMYLPAVQEQQPVATVAPVSALPRGRGQAILVADDEAAVRVICQHTLEAYGYRVYTASHGADAVALYALHPHEIAVVLTDLLMPIMDGTATIRALLRLDPNVKVILMSGTAMPGQLNQLLPHGAWVALGKPFTAAELLHALDQLLNPPA